MAIYTQNFDLDMLPGAVPVHVPCSQFDKNSEIRFTLYLNGVKFIPSVTPTVRIKGTKPDGHGYEALCTYSSGVVTVTTDVQMTACYGHIPFELRLTANSGETDVGTANFIMDIEESPLQAGTVVSASEFSAFQALADKAAEDANKAATNAARVGRGSSIISDFAGTSTYASVFNNAELNTDYVGYYNTANKSDSYSGDSNCKHFVIFRIPHDKNYAIVNVYSTAGNHTGFYNSSNKTITWV